MSASNATRARSPTSSMSAAGRAGVAAAVADLVDGRELGRAAAGLVDEAGVLRGRRRGSPRASSAGAGRPRRRRRRGRGSGATGRLRPARRRLSGDERGPTAAARRRSTAGLPYVGRLAREVVDDQRLGGLEDVLAEADQRDRRLGQSRQDLVRGTGSVAASRRRRRRCRATWASKISWILSPTSSYIACVSSCCGEALLDAVDDRQLGRALVGLGEQPAGLVEQPGVLERDAQAGREGRSAGGRRPRRRRSRRRGSGAR